MRLHIMGRVFLSKLKNGGSDPVLLETNHFEIGPNRLKIAIGWPKTALSPNLFTRNFGVIHLSFQEFLVAVIKNFSLATDFQ